jgi:hypothetical protein
MHGILFYVLLYGLINTSLQGNISATYCSVTYTRDKSFNSEPLWVAVIQHISYLFHLKLCTYIRGKCITETQFKHICSLSPGTNGTKHKTIRTTEKLMNENTLKIIKKDMKMTYIKDMAGKHGAHYIPFI